MEKIILNPGAFNPFHPHHWHALYYFGVKYKVGEGVLILSYKHPEKNNLLDIEKRGEIIETYIEEAPLGFPIEVSLDEKITESTGRSIINECERRGGGKYLLLGLDVVLNKLPKMEDYKKILELATLMVNDYDGEIIGVKKYHHETRIDTKSGGVTLPIEMERVIIDKNPFSGLHSTDIRNDPDKYLYLFPEKTKKLIEKYYIEGE